MRSLCLIAVLAGTAAADDVTVEKVIGKTYTVTTTYTEGLPPDCGKGGRPCGPARTKVVTRDVKVGRADLAVSTFTHKERGRLMRVECIDLADVPGPAEFPHRLGEAIVKPGPGAPILPLLVDADTGAAVATKAPRCFAVSHDAR
jgi:hypothetical protein